MSILKLQAKYGLEDSSVAQPDEELTQQFEEDVETAVDPDEEVEVVDIAVSVEALNATGITAGLDYHDRAVEDELTALDDVQSAMVAVEAYLGLLENREQRNLALTDDVATAMRIGLESIDANFFSNVAVSLENQVAIRDNEPEGDGELDDDSSDRASKAKGVNDKLKSKWTTLWEALKRVFNRVLNAATEFYNNLKNNTTKLLETINSLAKEATELDGGIDFQIRGAERLMVDGKFVGDKAESYKTIADNADIILGKIPTEGLKILKEWSKEGATDHDDFSGSLDRSARQSFKTLEELVRFASKVFSDFDELGSNDPIPSSFGENQTHKVWSSKVMMGDRAYYGAMGNEEAMRGGSSKFLMTEFSTTPNSETVKSLANVELKTFTSMQALSALKGCKVLLDLVDGYKSERSAFNKEAQLIISGEWENIFKRSPNVKQTIQARFASINFANQITKNNWRFTGYIITIAKTLTVLVSAMLEAERGDTVKGKTAEA